MDLSFGFRLCNGGIGGHQHVADKALGPNSWVHLGPLWVQKLGLKLWEKCDEVLVIESDSYRRGQP